MLAYTIVGQNKNIYEAEIDSICELVDFLRFNVYFAETIINNQPINTTGIENISEYNSLNGYIASITPFNFTAIGGNLASAPLLFGNSVLWKPSDNAILSNYLFYEIMLEAGLPKGVLNFCPMEPKIFLNNNMENEDMAGILFTGSSKVFENIFCKMGKNINKFNNFPKIIGESGGKNFHFIHNINLNDNDLDLYLEKTIESAFNYSGQKCSAASILYLPESLLNKSVNLFENKVEKYLENQENYDVINEIAYNRLKNYLNSLKDDNEIEFIVSGINTDDRTYFIHPHILVCKNHSNDIYNKELFGPVLTIYPYKETEINETIELLCNNNNYALTGSIFSNDNKFIKYATNRLKHKTGNFYINDKSTGSVVGQQPFGGSGKSGTNYKAGDINFMYKLFNQRNIKKVL